MTRILTALGLLIVGLYLIFLAPNSVFLVGAIAFGVLCYREFDQLVIAHSIRRPGLLGLAGGLVILIWPQFTLLAVSLLVLLSFITALRFADLGQVLAHVACVVLGVFYTFAPWRFASELRAETVHLLFFALALNWIGDSAAYYVGRAIGKRRLAPVVSPKKSLEGAAAAVISSAVFGALYLGHFVPQIPLWQVIVIAVIANIAGQFGDLAESAIKRGAGVKDSGQLLPGHGGMLDRFDSSLFALPVVYGLVTLFRMLSGWR